MRFVPASCLRPGMVTARDLFGKNNELLLAKGQKLTAIEIERIKSLRYPGMFIEDELSKDIQAEFLVDWHLRNNTVKAIKDVFNLTGRGQIDQKHMAHLKDLVEETISEISINDDVIFNMMDLKVFDDYTYYHSVNVFILSIVIGVSLGLSRSRLYDLGMGAILHDIGKVFVPKEILEKNGRLTEEEFVIMKTHSEKGWAYLREHWDISYESTLAVLTHHEKFDGTGYPFQIPNEKIPLYGRIIAVCDVYDALTSDRPYRKAMSPSEAMEYIMGGSGTYFDPNVVQVFVRKVMPYPVGTCVQLSNGQVGIVAKNYSHNCLRPKVKLLKGETNIPHFYDLYFDKNLLNITISEIANV